MSLRLLPEYLHNVGGELDSSLDADVSKKVISEHAVPACKTSRQAGRSVPVLKARTSMVDGFPYKEEVGGSSPSVPTNEFAGQALLA